MGCNIQYFLDHDLAVNSTDSFLAEFKKRIAPVQLYISNPQDDFKSFKDLGIKECWSICFESDVHNLDEASICYYKEKNTLFYQWKHNVSKRKSIND